MKKPRLTEAKVNAAMMKAEDQGYAKRVVSDTGQIISWKITPKGEAYIKAHGGPPVPAAMKL